MEYNSCLLPRKQGSVVNIAVITNHFFLLVYVIILFVLYILHVHVHVHVYYHGILGGGGGEIPVRPPLYAISCYGY